MVSHLIGVSCSCLPYCCHQYMHCFLCIQVGRSLWLIWVIIGTKPCIHECQQDELKVFWLGHIHATRCSVRKASRAANFAALFAPYVKSMVWDVDFMFVYAPLKGYIVLINVCRSSVDINIAFGIHHSLRQYEFGILDRRCKVKIQSLLCNCSMCWEITK